MDLYMQVLFIAYSGTAMHSVLTCAQHAYLGAAFLYSI